MCLIAMASCLVVSASARQRLRQTVSERDKSCCMTPLSQVPKLPVVSACVAKGPTLDDADETRSPAWLRRISVTLV